MTKLSKSKVIEAIHEKKGAVYLAAKKLQCSHTAVYNYVKKYPDVREAKEYYTEERSDIAEYQLGEAIKRGEPWAIKYQLSTQGKKRGYVERSEITGSDGSPITWKQFIEGDSND